MQPSDFVVKPDTALTAEDFALSPLWAGYYEPDDVDEIVRWGIDEDRVRAALDAVGWEDDHYFPLPVEAVNSRWGRGRLFGVQATTRDGTTLAGYVGENRDVVVLFREAARFVLSGHTPQEAARLSKHLHEGALFPIAVTNCVTGERWKVEF